MIIERVLVPNRTPILQLYGLTSGSAVGSPVTGTAISGRPARYLFNIGSPDSGYYSVDVYTTDPSRPLAAFNLHVLADDTYRVLEEVWQDPDLNQSGSGSGENAVTITAMNGVLPIQGARVTVHQSGTVLAYGTTNVSGQIVLLLADGTFSLNVSAAGFVPIVNQSLVVDGVESVSVAMTSATLTPSPYEGLCNVTFAVSHNGNAVSGARVSAKLTAKNNTLDKFLESREVTEGETNSEGVCVLTLVQFASFTRGGTYQIKVTDPLGQVLHDRVVQIPTLSAVNAEDLPDL